MSLIKMLEGPQKPQSLLRKKLSMLSSGERGCVCEANRESGLSRNPSESIIRFAGARSPLDPPKSMKFESGFCGLPVCSRNGLGAAPQSLFAQLRA